uniref:Dynactin subunit 6 n=1 Tax=Aceria tosichella TaxID=561515 RepID=A0A6G1SLB9_9ACAR
MMTSSILPTHPENFAKLKCPPSTIICREKTIILGDVTIGPDCVVHPTARIIARNGPIRIGSNNLIEERVTIINNFTEPMIIGDNNVFEVYSQCETRTMGSNNIIECKAFVGSEIELTNNCIVGAGCQLPHRRTQAAEDKSEHREQRQAPIDVFKPNTEVYGSDLHRRVVQDLPASSHGSQLDFLRKILPNYQKLWRPANLPATPPTQR